MQSNILKNRRFFFLGREYGLAFLFFVGLTVVLSWPTVRSFTTEYVGHPSDDPRHNLWFLWHVKEAVLGRGLLYEAPLLFYPAGVSMHLHGIGPLMGVLALPFWPLGAAAAYNGATLLAFALSGFAIYLLARGVGLSQMAALFTGTLYSMTPLHLGGLFGHFEKVFTAVLPLVLLTTLLGMDAKRSRWWAVGTAVVLLMALLVNGLLFIEAALGAGFFVVVALLRSGAADRRELVRRMGIMGVSSLVLVGPLLWATAEAANIPGAAVDLNLASPEFQPDLAYFFLPPIYSRIFGERVQYLLELVEISDQVEKWIYLSWTGMVLAVVALVKQGRRSWPWILFTAGWAVLALGPTLQVLGHGTFTEYSVPLIMPYAFFTMLPGMNFLRTPGRLMLMGLVGFCIAAGIGLHYLTERWPRRRWVMAAVVTLLVFLEGWPRPWPNQPLPTVPPFYQQLAKETAGFEDETGAEFGVLDLPILPPEANWYVSYSARYQLYQMTHGKGIAAGYISRPYRNHPLFPCLMPVLLPPQQDVQVNGVPANCYANILHDLAFYNYRYVVWHKPQPGDGYSANPAEVEASSAYLLDLLDERPPLFEDEMTTVYAVPPLTTAGNLSPTMGLLHNWYRWDGERRWATSPASLFISTPRPLEAELVIVPNAIYDPALGRSLGPEGRLTVLLNGVFAAEIVIHPEESFSVPLSVPAGVSVVTLALEAGSFRPVDRRGTDTRWLSFAVRSINLEVGE